MGWYQDDDELTNRLRQLGYDVDEDTVAAARLNAGRDFPLGDEDLKDIIPLLDAEKVKRQPAAFPEEIEEFRHKLASPEWEQRLAAVRKRLDLDDSDEARNFERAADLFSHLAAMLQEDEWLMAGRASTLKDALPSLEVLGWWVEFGRGVAALASYLGTSSTLALVRLLLGGDAFRPEDLTPAPPQKAFDEFHKALLQGFGFGADSRTVFPGAFLKAHHFRDVLLLAHVWNERRDASCDWEATRIRWNKLYPAWGFDSTEAIRKAYERADKRPHTSLSD